jgi:hypothetical protein
MMMVFRIHRPGGPLPAVDRVGSESFGPYHAEHVRRTRRLVIIPMLLELLSSLALVVRRPAGVGPGLAWAGLAAVAATWLSTAFLQVPRHDDLARGFDASAYRSLVATNGFRAACWTLHAAILLVMTALAIPS